MVALGSPAPAPAPTLAAVRAAVPDELRVPSGWRSGLATIADGSLYLALVAAAVIVGPSWWLVAIAPATGVMVAALFVLGHDAAHRTLFGSRPLDRLAARILMLPSLHVAEAWVLGHNRVHHGFTTREGMDFVWHPSTPEQFSAMSTWGRRRHRLEWSAVGSGLYYGREVWWNKMIAFRPSGRHAERIASDRRVVGAWAVVSTLFVVVIGTWRHGSPVAGLAVAAAALVVPFVVFLQIIGWTVYVHHVAPDIRWWSRAEWTPYRAQMESTTVLRIPAPMNLVFHNIFVHVPHHVDQQIPWHHLPAAAAAIERADPGVVRDRRFRVRDYLEATRTCKLYDFEAGTWRPYPS